MGVNTKSFDNASDMITFSRASGGYGFTKVSYGTELVDTNTANWARGIFSVDGTLEYSGNTFTATVGAGDTSSSPRWVLPISTVIGNSYAFAATIGGNAGSFSVSPNSSGTSAFAFLTATGSLVFTAIGTTTYLTIANNGAAGSTVEVTAGTVKEVTYNSSDPSATLKLTYHPNDVPRIEYNLDGSPKGILIEEARTNISSNSLSFQANSGCSDAPSTETAPDGSTNATLVTASGSGFHRLKAGSTTTFTHTGVAYAISTFVKNVDANYVQILNGGDADYFANFDLVNGTVGTTGSATTATITEYSNGWFRLAALFDGTGHLSHNGTYIYIAPSASAVYGQGANNPGAQMHLWGFQTEAGSFPTSYIETTGATATRAVDLASIPVSKFGYNQSAGTLFVDFKTPDTAGTGGADALELGDSAASTNRYIIRNGLAYYRTAGGVQVVITYTPSTNNQRAGFAVQSNDAVSVVNGSTIGTDNSVTLFSNPTILGIGARAYNLATEKLNGHIKSIQYYPRRLTDAQLQELTT